MTKIFITGGHYTPARAVIDELLKDPQWDIFYLGRKFAMEDDDALALEYQELMQISRVKYLLLKTGRLQRKFFVNIGQSIRALLRIFVGLFQSFYYFLKYEPQIVLSFGGYLALPVVFWGWAFGVPVITHEQTLSIGLAGKLIAFFASKKLSVLDVGNPIRSEIRNTKPNVKKTNTIFVTGGNQGAHVLNVAVEEALPRLLKKFVVIHQTGDSHFNDYERLIKQNKNTAKFFDERSMAKNLTNADIVISRSGANICNELAYLGKPAILIPIPWSSSNEQMLNAKRLQEVGLAEILPQSELTGDSLYALVNRMSSGLKKYQSNGNKSKQLVKGDAHTRIVEILNSYVQ